MIRFSDRLNQMNESQTIAMARKSRELASKGIDVINLSLGEPDFYTPLHIREAAKTAIDLGYSHYTPVAGYADLREAIAQKLHRDNNLSFSPDQIVVSTGAKQSIFNVIMSVINPGDEVIVPAPYWVSYLEMIKLAEGVPVIVDCGIDQDFKINAHQLQAAITEKTRMFLFSSPGNPTGSVYDASELESLAAVFRKHPDILILSDEIYEFINFKGKHDSIAHCDGMLERTAIVNGLSKGYAMTGWRLGYVAAPLALAKACDKVQGQVTSATCSITQRAAIEALLGDDSACKEMVVAFKNRRNIVLEGIKDIQGFIPNMPEGAFYVFPDVSALFGKKTKAGVIIKDADSLCEYLLDEAHVALVTGVAFGSPNCIRISYATSDDKLKTALSRIKDAVNSLL
jgi:aspartate aminotransferase